MLNDSGAKVVLTNKETLPIIKKLQPKLKFLKHIITVDCNEFIELNDFIKDASEENLKRIRDAIDLDIFPVCAELGEGIEEVIAELRRRVKPTVRGG